MCALSNVSFSVPEGCVFGILGPNGSGKTTLLSIVTSILKPSSGNYSLFDTEPTDEHRRNMGTLLETPNFYHYLSAVKNLAIAAAIKGNGENNIDGAIETVGLSHRKNSAFSTYSLGMKQRLAIGAALLANPDVLIFDEPTNGLDPEGIADIRSLIKELAKKGKTIIMASHLLDEVEKVCTHVAILKQGKLIASGNVDEIFITDDIVMVNAENLSQLKNAATGLPGCQDAKETNEGLQLYFQSGTVQLAAINSYFFDKGVTLSQLQLKRSSLENKFFQLTGK
ncbi:MAG: ABC transporter ATP-binding protein [Ferruginibacter sp.]|nr:ABC transporter ATP-binding protein [Ferruginibacter sp.]